MNEQKNELFTNGEYKIKGMGGRLLLFIPSTFRKKLWLAEHFYQKKLDEKHMGYEK